MVDKVVEKELKKKLQEEVALIQKLKRHPPNCEVGSTEWNAYQTKISDAYWRKRMLMVRLEGGNIERAAGAV